MMMMLQEKMIQMIKMMEIIEIYRRGTIQQWIYRRGTNHHHTDYNHSPHTISHHRCYVCLSFVV